MKSFKKSILALGLALGVLAGMGGAAVNAAQTQTGSLAGVSVMGKSDITYNKGTAYTTCGGYGGSVSVSSTYYYCKTSDGTSAHKGNGAGDSRSAGVSFSAPTTCKSISISSSHKFYYSGQLWSTSTFDDKE